jgi:hypothetical protein
MSDALAIRDESPEPPFVGIDKLLETFEFENRTESAESRAPERNGPFGENELPLPISSPEPKIRNRC